MARMEGTIENEVGRSEISGIATRPSWAHWSEFATPVVLLTSDVTAFLLSFFLSGFLANTWTEFKTPVQEGLWPIAIWSSAMGAALLGLALAGLYTPSFLDMPTRMTLRGLGVISFVAMGSMAGASLARPELLTYAAFAWMVVVPFFVGARLFSTLALRLLSSLGVGTRKVLVLGSGLGAAYATHKLESHGVRHRLAGCIDLGPVGGEGAIEAHLEEIKDAVHRIQPWEVMIAAPPSQMASIEAAIRPLLPRSVPVRFALYTLSDRLQAHDVDVLAGDFLTVRVQPDDPGWPYGVVRRALDIPVAVLALLVAAPAMLAIAVAIKLDSRGPVLFRQTRVGRHGRTFTMYKFRSMHPDAEAMQEELRSFNDADGPLFKIRRDPRITHVGRIIRRFSLDELPQLFNVLEGTMGLVGPRPALPGEVAQYEDWQLRRLAVLPGVTGLWQVSRRRCSSFQEMVWLDLEYVEKWSLALDLSIVFRTVPAMLGARGAY